MQTVRDVYNAALARLGGEQMPVDVLPGDASLTICEGAFPRLLDLALVAHCWSFALARATLTRLAGGGPASARYRYRYALPAVCLRPVALDKDVRLNRTPAYAIEGAHLLTCEEQPVLVFITRVTDPAAWPPAFAEALVWSLAETLAAARLNDSQKQNWCAEHYKDALRDAITLDLAAQNLRHDPPQSAWGNARFSGGVL